ncbi:hypothetical protein SAMN05216421_3065 [Halopseudomonas xinjiangensis]|uniref:Cytochrome oxidase Cu insertion factor, SCO1/SenC/PrrC family n=1 Tax=Halopseudomonas xinjiangensis TaxID=487184 RepID=A0A1H1Y7G4_9GAMM|nr:hypothetical protein [Halopseudomonas xinjiangensis]SDT17159.1 hypothetical protein SAMN05216421_3065 [Halopseudomonas xinjiangensis]
MENHNPSDTTPPRRGQLKLLAVFAVVIGPIFVAWLMARSGYGVPESHTNKSDLVESAISVQTWGAGVEPLGYGAPWRLTVTTPGDCEEACLALVHEARQINVALGREAGRVEHVLLQAHPASPALRERLDSEFPRLTVLPLNEAAYRDSLDSQPQAWRQQPQLWVIDPLGRVVLRRNPERPARQILDDLKHLLKVSKIG